MSERQLATIRTIESLAPIAGADRIEQARVMGWTVVTKKGEFRTGDPCVFFEIDSVLPETDWAEFMRPRAYRVKTAKLRGVLSQGLALPVSILGDRPVRPGEDVTAFLGVTQYEPPLPVGLDVEGPFPALIPKTDALRLQSALLLLEELAGLPYYVTVKLDGMSGTFARTGSGFQACSRRYAMKDGNNAFWNVARRYSLAERIPEGLALQGEVCGPGIQKNRLGLQEASLFVFDVFDTAKGLYLDWDDALGVCAQLGVPVVPEVQRGESFADDLDALLALAQGRYEGTRNRREGIVVRPLATTRSSALGGDRLSFKVLNNDFLLKDEE